MSLALPLRCGTTGPLVVLDEDSSGEIQQSVAVLLSTRVGERRSEPTYGSADTLGVPLGAGGGEVDAGALAVWEPRASVEQVQVIATGSPS